MKWTTVSAVAGALVAGTILISYGISKDLSAKTVARADGKALYLMHCASCHGANLEGQPDWRRRKPDGRLPAPPHDATGHTWHHPDDVLFKITKLGTEAIVGGNYKSDMPGFAEVMTDDEIRATLDYIKSTWPESISQRQQRMNRRQQK